MGRKLTQAEIDAYRSMARAAAKLRKAQEQAEADARRQREQSAKLALTSTDRQKGGHDGK
jgi:hypothetical protein